MSDANDNQGFSKRVKEHPGIQVYRPRATDPLVLLMKDHLLVAESVSQQVQARLAELEMDSTVLTTLFDGVRDDPRLAGIEDVEIVAVSPRQGAAAPDIAKVARDLRTHLLAAGEEGKVSPNHVLVPAGVGHSCPYGPPEPVTGVPVAVGPNGQAQPVTVIDSGYQWKKAWGANPLETLCRFKPVEAERLGTMGWEPGIPDDLDVNGDSALDALAGHANFVAGVVAQQCPDAEITIWNHNGGFDPNSDDYPTEATVCRSLVKSQLRNPTTGVIDVGFAFYTFDRWISRIWDSALKALRQNGDPIVVAPAGNQGSRRPYYPAALGLTYPNVVGVASHSGGGTQKKSGFSNYGPWVTCSAIGGDVASTFLCIDMPVEDDHTVPRPSRDFTANSWASWNGTSFAAPKVVGAIAGELAAKGATPADAWNAVLALGRADPAGNLGIKFAF